MKRMSWPRWGTAFSCAVQIVWIGERGRRRGGGGVLQNIALLLMYSYEIYVQI
jgi:hypothetical protein